MCRTVTAAERVSAAVKNTNAENAMINYESAQSEYHTVVRTTQLHYSTVYSLYSTGYTNRIPHCTVCLSQSLLMYL